MVCFPEPDAHELADPVKAMGEYLAYAHNDRARELRAALNDLLGAMPPDIAAQFCHRLRVEHFRRVWFELFVGRFLQLAGATDLAYGPVGVNGKSPDWKATFPGEHVVYVEATSPQFRQEWDDARVNHQPLLEIIDQLMPDGWSYVVKDLPTYGPDDRRSGFKTTVRRMLADVPDAATSSATLREPLNVRAGTPLGPVNLDLVVGGGASPFLMGPFYGGIVHNQPVIADAVRGKRPQGRAFPGQVLVALDTAPGTDLEDLEVALLGSRVSFYDRASGEIVPDYRFDATGVLVKQTRPEFVGVLPFLRLNLLGGGPDPILFRHPLYEGQLPEALMGLARREYDGRGILEIPATGPKILPFG